MVPPDDVPASMPERIGRFELLFPIGTGGMGTVYLGRAEVMPGVKRNVAVKLMHGELRANPDIGPQLMREAQLAASIQHPNVVAVLEAGDSPHGVYLVMDHVEGDTLAGLIRAARKRDELIPLRIAGKIMRDALTGLHAAHELKGEDGHALDLVHRDFSPHNILIGVDGTSLLTDFGIAKALSHANATATGIVKGKVGYMAPEQARGERVDRRSDVWAAGVVCWEVLTAKRLFRASNDAATLLQVVSGKRPPLVSSHRRDVPDRLDEAVAAALEPKPNRRTATALALRKQIEEALFDQGGLADEDEVAAFVKELVGQKVQQNRKRADSVLDLRAKLADISESAAKEQVVTGSGTLGTPPEPAEFRDESGTRAALTAVSGKRAVTKSRWPWGIAAVLVGVLGAVGFMTLQGRSKPLATGRAPEPAAAQSSKAKPSDVLTVIADEPIAQLSVDARTIVMPEAVRELDVPVGEARPSKLVALTQDGRRVEVKLTGQTRVELTFPQAPEPEAAASASASTPIARPVRPAPPPKPPIRPPTPPGDGLADSPYGAK